MGKKKNRSNNAEDKDQVIAKLTKQNEDLQKKLDRLLDRIERQDREQEESGGGAASAAAKKKEQEEAARKAADKKKAAEKEKAWHLRKAEEKEKENSKRAGDTLDEEWEIVDRETKKERRKREPRFPSTVRPSCRRRARRAEPRARQ